MCICQEVTGSQNRNVCWPYRPASGPHQRGSRSSSGHFCCIERTHQCRLQIRRTLQAGEPGAEPLAVRHVLPLQQEREVHDFANQPRGDHPRAKLVAGFRAPTGKCFLLLNPSPLTLQHIAPHILRIPAHELTDTCQLAGGVLPDSTGDCQWRGSLPPYVRRDDRSDGFLIEDPTQLESRHNAERAPSEGQTGR